jgi:hypothetical protein
VAMGPARGAALVHRCDAETGDLSGHRLVGAVAPGHIARGALPTWRLLVTSPRCSARRLCGCRYVDWPMPWTFCHSFSVPPGLVAQSPGAIVQAPPQDAWDATRVLPTVVTTASCGAIADPCQSQFSGISIPRRPEATHATTRSVNCAQGRGMPG